MAKKIKKQIRKSVPLLMVLILISSMFSTLVFNMNFDIKNLVENSSINDLVSWTQEVQADTATTTVTVRNAPPGITVAPAENPTSSSTSPVNVGGSIGFNATGDDPENNSYYLIVCDSDGVTASSTGGAPSCTGTQFCVSALTGDTNQASCTYSNVTDPSAETDAWFAYLCDNHATEADCSTTNKQGSGDSGSPIYINHSPTFTAVNTTVNNQDPGGTFTITGSATDADSQGGVDDLIMSVCRTNSYSVVTGCDPGEELCTGTSTTPDVSCDYVDTAPTPHGAYTYYAFIKDWHIMQAADSRTSNYSINNVAPTVGNTVLSDAGGGHINLNIKGATEVTINASSTNVQDLNGCTDLVDATSTVYLSSVANGASCAADDNNCYQVTNATCAVSDCSGDADSLATVICTTQMAFYTIPTNTGDYSASSWFAKLTAYDATLAGSDTYNTLNGVEVQAAAALDISQLQISYGTVKSGQNTGTANATSTIVNYGNTPLDTDVSGTNMTGPNTILINQQEYGLANFAWGAGTQASSSPVTVAVVIGRPTNDASLSDDIYWGIGIPGGKPSGIYSGINTFAAALDPSDPWN